MTDRPLFTKPFTQQEPLPEVAIERAVEVMRSGRLHRYNVIEGETSETELLEREYAAYQEADYCLACASGGQALQIALRASGVAPGDKVLANAYTLAPVPGAMHAVGSVPVFVEIDDHYHIDCADLEAKAEASGAKFLMLSHMRGHIADMERVMAICDARDITVIEDCAHTMGARWNGVPSGNFGRAACFSTQTYKHMNSGEGGLLTTDDAELAARATILSGSYMLYGRHGAGPDEEVFERVRLDAPNCSARMDNLRAAILRPQLRDIDQSIARWNSLYGTISARLSAVLGLAVPERDQREAYVGSSFQFRVIDRPVARIPELLERCAGRGVEIKWFGADRPNGFTSRYDSWRYLGDIERLPVTDAVLARTCDLRLPLTFDTADVELIAEIIADEVGRG